MIVIRIENINDQFCQIFLFNSFVIISSVKLIKLEVRNSLRVPYTQRVDYMVAVSYDRHIVGNSHNRFIVFLDEFILACYRIFFKTDISAETYFLRILFPAELKGVALFEPVVRHLDLVAVPDLLFEHTVTVADTAAVRRIVQSSKGIKKTCRQSSQTSVSKSRVRLLILYDIQVNSHLIQRFLYIFIHCHIDQVISQSAAHKEFH